MPNILQNSGWETRPTVNSTVFGITHNSQQRNSSNSSVCDILNIMQDEKIQDQKNKGWSQKSEQNHLRGTDSILDLVILEDKLISQDLGLDMSNINENLDMRCQESWKTILDWLFTKGPQNYLRQEYFEAIFDGFLEEAQDPSII